MLPIVENVVDSEESVLEYPCRSSSIVATELNTQIYLAESNRLLVDGTPEMGQACWPNLPNEQRRRGNGRHRERGRVVRIRGWWGLKSDGAVVSRFRDVLFVG